MKIVYVCFNCKNEIKRPVKEGELIMIGNPICEKCDKKIIHLKIIKE
jgi:DNA-directed RNA polymerase subunit RPC12/RpoP